MRVFLSFPFWLTCFRPAGQFWREAAAKVCRGLGKSKREVKKRSGQVEAECDCETFKKQRARGKSWLAWTRGIPSRSPMQVLTAPDAA